MGWAKHELDRMEREAPLTDQNMVTWTRIIAQRIVECAHCDGDIEPGEEALHADTGHDWMHTSCWDGHVGFLEAVGKDD